MDCGLEVEIVMSGDGEERGRHWPRLSMWGGGLGLCRWWGGTKCYRCGGGGQNHITVREGGYSIL